MAIVTNNIVQVKLFTYYEEKKQVGINILHWLAQTHTGTGAKMAEFLTTLAGTWPDLIKDAMTEHAEYRGMRGQIVNAVPLPVSEDDTTDPGPGTVTGDPMPTNVCGLLTWRTQYGGRAYRGRLYSCFPAASAINAAGEPDTAFLAALNLIGDNYVNNSPLIVGVAPNTATMIPVLYHREAGGATPILKYTVRNTWGQQHRRGDHGSQNPLPM